MLADSCLQCEDLQRGDRGLCPGRPPARTPTSGSPKFTGRKERLSGKLVDEVHVLHKGSLGELYCKLLQLIDWPYGRVQRLCYYVITPEGKAYWGQFAPMYNPGELERLLELARAKEMI